MILSLLRQPQLAGALSRFLIHEQNVGQVCIAAAEVDIMIGQLRANGMGAIMADEKIRRLQRLAQRLLAENLPDNEGIAFAPDRLINDALEARLSQKGRNFFSTIFHRTDFLFF